MPLKLEDVISNPDILAGNEPTQELTRMPNLTWGFDLDKGEFTGAKISGIQAYGQAMRKAIMTERDTYVIYDEFYGCEIHLLIADIIGTPEYKEAQAKVMITETVMDDDRTQAVEDITLTSVSDQMQGTVDLQLVPDFDQYDNSNKLEVTI